MVTSGDSTCTVTVTAKSACITAEPFGFLEPRRTHHDENESAGCDACSLRHCRRAGFRERQRRIRTGKPSWLETKAGINFPPCPGASSRVCSRHVYPDPAERSLRSGPGVSAQHRELWL